MFTLVLATIAITIIIIYIKLRNHVPILMYHRIANVPGERNSLPEQKFKEQLLFLKRYGFTTLTLSELYRYYTTGSKPPKRAVVLTFDDGYEDNFSVALPLLLKYKMKATVFPIANWVAKENRWEKFNQQITTTMNWEQLKQWHSAGMEIGSHTLNHPFLNRCDAAQLEAEIVISKQVLEHKLGCPINFLCYPYGAFNHNSIMTAQAAGYKGAVAIFENAAIWNLDLFSLPRIPIPSRQPLWEFALKVSPLYILFVILRKLERSYKHLIHNKK